MSDSAPWSTLRDLAQQADYSLLDTLRPDPDATASGVDHDPRQVFSGHYVPVRPTPLPDPAYVAHSPTLFAELGLADELAHTDAFRRFFTADLSQAPEPLRRLGWATGYALSIYGQEYQQQCPFGTGNGYGDGRALSVFEGRLGGRRWEMQLKGAGRTPYCRGGDGRAVLRSSVREFLAQEHMHALGVPTTRSLCLFASTTEQIRRPWYGPGSRSTDPDRWVLDPAAITTRVAPSFLRVGQLELFARRARRKAHPEAMEELEQLLVHVIEREYPHDVPRELPLGEQLVHLARAFRARLVTLVSHWIRVGYCQGNFNGDNCALGGFTLDYGPFGFMDVFDPTFQPWTGGGMHFAFLNQPQAAGRNYGMFCQSLLAWSGLQPEQRRALTELHEGFAEAMRDELLDMWAAKLGLPSASLPLVQQLMGLLQRSRVDYTIFFRRLCDLPRTLDPLREAFYPPRPSGWVWKKESVDEEAWASWLTDWRSALALGSDRSAEQVGQQMRRVNPMYVLREWHLVPAYQAAAEGDHELVRQLQAVMTRPYDEQGDDTVEAYFARKPEAYFGQGGVSHMSCSS
jgi:uncharacterized protein YdiU (UPF0061 family)